MVVERVSGLGSDNVNAPEVVIGLDPVTAISLAVPASPTLVTVPRLELTVVQAHAEPFHTHVWFVAQAVSPIDPDAVIVPPDSGVVAVIDVTVPTPPLPPQLH